MKKHIPLPDFKENGPADKSHIFEVLEDTAKKINSHNVFWVMHHIDRRRRKQNLRAIYSILRDIYPNYNTAGILAEMRKHTGMSERTIKREIYKKRKNLKSSSGCGKN